MLILHKVSKQVSSYLRVRTLCHKNTVSKCLRIFIPTAPHSTPQMICTPNSEETLRLAPVLCPLTVLLDSLILPI